MGRYRKIDTRIWNDSKFCALSDNAKLAFFFLLTHPHMTSLGAMRCTVRGLASEVSWSEKQFRAALEEITRAKMLELDESACFIALPNFLKYNKPESPNVVTSWAESLDLLPECELKAVLLQRVKAFAEGLSEAFAKALPKAFETLLAAEGLGEAFQKAMPNQEQEQEHKQEQEQDSLGKTPDALEFMTVWNATVGVRPIRKLGGRAAALKARLREPDWDWRAALAKFPLKCFSDPNGFIPNLEFFVRPETVNSILEGKYDWTPSVEQSTSNRKVRPKIVDFTPEQLEQAQ